MAIEYDPISTNLRVKRENIIQIGENEYRLTGDAAILNQSSTQKGSRLLFHIENEGPTAVEVTENEGQSLKFKVLEQ